MLSRIAEAGSLDGVLLELHGSMVVGNLDSADGLDDAEGHIPASVRELVPECLCWLRSQQMIDQADVLIGRETYPEIGMAARERESADVLEWILSKLVCVRQWHYTNCRWSGE